VPDVTNGEGRYEDFARDFATADGERVMVTAITPKQFADLVKATRLARTFAFLERVLCADFSTCSDLYNHRDTIAALLAPWFSRRAVVDLAARSQEPRCHRGVFTTSLANRDPGIK
jgi:2-methylfumaryl-CoA isomerase